jgi:hypothetical protein
MKYKLFIGIAGGALALALAGGAALAGPALDRTFAATTQAASPTARADAAPAARGRQPGKGALLAAALIKASAEVAGTRPREVLAALRDGQSLSQYAKGHGKSDAAVIQAARANVQDRLSKAQANGKLTQAQADALLKKFDDGAPALMADANLRQQLGRAVARRHPLAAGLVKATADVTGTQPEDVRAAVQQGQSLADYAQAHGKTADDILARLRELGQQRLDQALERAKQLIEQPGLGGATADEATPTQ